MLIPNIYLAKNESIISSTLNEDMETKLLEVLKKNKKAFAWSIKDIKGISPLVCMHKILMENEYTLLVEHQRRLNPAMKEVLKWLHAGFLYAIYDNSWVSPVQVVLKKGDMIMVRNDKNELISTCTITG